VASVLRRSLHTIPPFSLFHSLRIGRPCIRLAPAHRVMHFGGRERSQPTALGKPRIIQVDRRPSALPMVPIGRPSSRYRKVRDSGARTDGGRGGRRKVVFFCWWWWWWWRRLTQGCRCCRDRFAGGLKMGPLFPRKAHTHTVPSNDVGRPRQKPPCDCEAPTCPAGTKAMTTGSSLRVIPHKGGL